MAENIISMKKLEFTYIRDLKTRVYSAQIDNSIVLPSSLNLVHLYGISSAAGDDAQEVEPCSIYYNCKWPNKLLWRVYTSNITIHMPLFRWICVVDFLCFSCITSFLLPIVRVYVYWSLMIIRFFWLPHYTDCVYI